MLRSTRKGYRRCQDIPADVRARLNTGQEETITLVELLVVDFEQLWQAALPQLAPLVLDPSLGITQRMKLAGEHWAQQTRLCAIRQQMTHSADIVRGWSAYAVVAALSAAPSMDLEAVFEYVKPLADDPNPGVREWVWLACRPLIVTHPQKTIDTLVLWTQSKSANIRRFASESTRPRGVWCAHSATLKTTPEMALPILEPLKADDSRYVQDSVANWLNDASKDNPDWVVTLCQRWLKASPVKSTQRICQRAQRSLTKQCSKKIR